MVVGQTAQDELPDEAKGEDLTTLSGRLRAAMVRALKPAKYSALKEALEAAGFTINKQTVHNWFRPSCQFIEPIWLFRVAKVLDISPEWLSTGEGTLAPPKVISDDRAQVIEMWDSLKTDAARKAWIGNAHSILELMGEKSRAAPFGGTHAEVEGGKKAPLKR